MSWTRCSESKCGNESPVFQSVKCSFVVFVWQNCRENALIELQVVYICRVVNKNKGR